MRSKSSPAPRFAGRSACGTLLLLAGALAPLVGCVPPGRSAGPAPNRPGVAESAETVGAGVLQAEGGYRASRSGEESSHAFGELRVRYGIGDRGEVHLGLSSYARTRTADSLAAGLEDASLGLKLRLPEGGGWRPRAAVGLGTTLPTGTGGMGARALQPGGMLSLAWDTGARAGLTSTLGYTYARAEGGRAGAFSADASWGYALTRTFGGFAAYALSHSAAGQGSTTHTLTGGFSYLVGDDLQIDLWSGRTLDRATPEYLFGAGFTRRW